VGKVTGFLETARKGPPKESVEQRLRHFGELEHRLPVVQAVEQAGRCMSCGVPFCHTGCPLGNAIPDWNDHVYRGRTDAAVAALEATNNFPEITGRICPAPCEEACVLRMDLPSHDGAPVTIRAIEREIAERAFERGLTPLVAERSSGKTVIVVGSGPAGLAAAQQLARAGHIVEVIERDTRVGGLLRYGIPDFKLDKRVLDVRLAQMEAEGVVFRTGIAVGRDETLSSLRARADAVVLATGATMARELEVPGRELAGIHRAMDYLSASNRLVSGEAASTPIDAAGHDVVILGGGDTGSDCLGTALRQGARCVTQIELMPRPPEHANAATPWPHWPLIYRTSSSQEEGGERKFAILTERFEPGAPGRVGGLSVVEVELRDGRFEKRPGTEQTIPATLVLLAMGFTGPDAATWTGSELALDPRGNVRADTTAFATSEAGVFACGDARRGQSLVVWAIWEGRECARAVDAFLVGQPRLPSQPQRWALARP
jgi:glutamate synthase (NADPH) small chain